MTPGGNFGEVLDLLRRTPLPPDEGPVQGATEDQLAAVRARYPMVLPGEYLDWLRVCNGTMAGPGGIYGVDTARDWIDAIAVLNLHPEWSELGWVPVAGDGNGNTYVLDASRSHIDRDAVFFVDAMGDEGPAYIAASSLSAFLRSLLQKELHEESRWPFDANHVTATDPDILLVRDSGLLPWFS